LKIVAGNPGKRALNKSEPKAQAWLDAAPDWFDDLQREYWVEALKAAPPMLLSTMDEGLLVVWVCAAVIHRRAVIAQTAVDQGKAAPLLTKTPGGMPVQSPYVGIINKQAVVMLKAASEMGFTPSARCRINLGEASGTENPFEQFG